MKDEKNIVLEALWKVYDMFRGYGQSDSRELLWLSMYLINYKIDSDLNKGNTWHSMQSIAVEKNTSRFLSLLSTYHKYDEAVDSVASNYENYEDVNSIMPNTLKELWKSKWYSNYLFTAIYYLTEIDFSKIDNVKDKIIEAYLDFLDANFNDKKYDGSLTNNKLRILIAKLIEIEPGESVCDPASGTGSIFLEIYKEFRKAYYNQTFKITSQEINQFLLSLQKLLLSTVENKYFILGDAIAEPPVQDNKLETYDKIVSDLPINIKNNQYKTIYKNDDFKRFEFGSPKNFDDYGFIQNIIALLNNNGTAIIAVVDGVLFRGGNEKEIRKAIIERDLIHAVIAIPEMIEKKLRLKRSLLVIKKNKTEAEKRKILFVYNTEEYSKLNDLDIEKILKTFSEFQETKNLSRVATIDEVINNNYDLSPTRYSHYKIELDERLKNDEYKRLADVVKFVNSRSTYVKGKTDGLQAIKTSDLEKGINEMDYRFEEKINKNAEGDILSEKSLLVSLIGIDLKPTIFDPVKINHKLVLDKNIVALIPSKIINLEYLYYQFYDPDVIGQIDSLRTGVTIPFISKHVLQNILIKIPTLEDQHKYIKDNYWNIQNLDKLKTEKAELEFEKKQVAQESEADTIRMLAHNILPDITIVQSSLDHLKNYLTAKKLMDDKINQIIDIDIELLNDDYYEEKVGEIISRIEQHLKKFADTISETKRIVQLGLDPSKFTDVCFSKLIEDHIAFRAPVYRDIFKIVTNIDKDIYFECDETAWKEVIDQFLRNARVHAFNKFSKRNRVIISLNDGWPVVLTITNNGKKFNLTEEEFKRKGEKGKNSLGLGLGGYYINKIVEAHDGILSIDETAKGLKTSIILWADTMGGGTVDI